MQADYIIETERTGGFYEHHCPCGYEDCDCRQRHDEEQEDIDD